MACGSGLLLATLTGHKGRVGSAEFNRHADKVATASFDGTAKIWQVENGSLIATLNGPQEGVFSAQFNWLGDKIATTFPVGTAKILEALENNYQF